MKFNASSILIAFLAAHALTAPTGGQQSGPSPETSIIERTPRPLDAPITASPVHAVSDHALIARYNSQKRALYTFYDVVSSTGQTFWRTIFAARESVRVSTYSLIALFKAAVDQAKHDASLPNQVVANGHVWSVPYTDDKGTWKLSIMPASGKSLNLEDIQAFCFWMTGAISDLPQLPTGVYRNGMRDGNPVTYLPSGQMLDVLQNYVGFFVLQAPDGGIETP